MINALDQHGVNSSAPTAGFVRLVALLLVMVSTSGNAADMPIGIPAPSFGLDETHEMYAGDAAYQMGKNGPYTHYVDNTSETCTESGNGTESLPSCRFPLKLAAGDVVEIHGGPYTFTARLSVDSAGTASAPVFIRGIDDGNGLPVLSTESEGRQLYLTGSYAIIEGLELSSMGMRIGGRSSNHHLVVRNLNVHSSEYTCIGLSGQHLMVLNSEIHHCRHETKDRHGVQVQGGSEYIWILGNHIHHNSANGIQYAHDAKSNPPDFVFVGNNHIHSDREVAVATKWAARTVVSSNIIHSIRPSRNGRKFCFDDDSGCITPDSSTNGPGIIIGAEGFPEEKWIIYNLIYDTNHCIRYEEGVSVFILGNVCANIPGGGVILEKRSKELVIAHNTFVNTGYRTGDGVITQNWRDQFAPQVHNNLFVSPQGPALWFESRSVTREMAFDNNLLWNGGEDMKVRWVNRNRKFGTLAELQKIMKSGVAEMRDNQVSDPLLTVPDGGPFEWDDFAPPANSPAVSGGNNILETLDARFRESFGDDVTIIPPAWQGGDYDIGAVAVRTPTAFAPRLPVSRPPPRRSD